MATELKNITEDGEITIKEFILKLQVWIRYILSKWLHLVIAIILGGVIGFFYSLLVKPQYVATTTFVLEAGDRKGGLGQYASMAAAIGINLGSAPSGLFQGDNIFELYKSRRMLAETLLSPIKYSSDELLIERFIAFNDLRNDWEKVNPEYLNVDFKQDTATLDSLTLRLRNGLITSIVNMVNDENLIVDHLDKKLSIIKVEVTSTDEDFSKRFNENLVKRVNDFYIRTMTKKSADNIALLEGKVDSIRNKMTGAIYSAAKVSDATPNLNPTRQVQRVAPAQEAQFSVETNKAILSQLVQNLELAKMNLTQEQPLIQVVDEPVYPLRIQRVGRIKGIIFGCFLFGFVTGLFFVAKKWYNDVMAE